MILYHFASNRPLDYERAIHGFIRLAVAWNIPIIMCEDSKLGLLSWFDSRISSRIVFDTILHLVKLPGKRLLNVMKQARGALLFDGSS